MERDLIRDIHAIAGAIVGISGLIQIILRKGGSFHRILGNIYFYSWFVIMGTGALLGSLLVTLFGVFGWYMAFTGYRFGKRKNSNSTLLDKIVISAGILFALSTLIWGVYILILGNITFGIVAVFFGAIFSFLCYKDILEFILKKPVRRLSNHPLQWYFEHFGRMIISYIAAITAFAVINNIFGIPLLNWILPTFIGTAIIIILNRRYNKKFNIRVGPKNK